MRDASDSMVLVEVVPGVVVPFGELPAELELDLLDSWLAPTSDRARISAVLSSIGNTAAVAGNLATAVASAQGLYRIGGVTQSLLNSGATLAVKDGANLGAVMLNGRVIAQARFVPVTAVSAAQAATALGPALAMVALQMQLSEITGLVKTNIALTSRVLAEIRIGQWAELMALVTTIDQAIDRAREIESVTTSEWEKIAGSETALIAQRKQYRLKVGEHLRQIHGVDAAGRRVYLEANAEAIVFDANALLSSLKAWIGYQALHAARARDSVDVKEARLVDVILRDTRAEFEVALPETKRLVNSLTRELRIIAELSGRDTLSMPSKRKDSAAARHAAARLLEAIEPLSDVLRPPASPLEAPDVVCAPESLGLEPYLRVLRWFLDDGETVRVLGFPEQLDALGPVSAILSGAKEKVAAARDKGAARTLVAITDRRIITAKASAFLEQGELREDIPLDQVRYVRSAAAQDKGGRRTIDPITRDENIRWLFPTDVEGTQVDAFAAVLAESMMIPEVERKALQQRHLASIEAGG
ncbi:hypothetical protein GCM10022221_06100 [Actinocorallia aurea]